MNASGDFVRFPCAADVGGFGLFRFGDEDELHTGVIIWWMLPLCVHRLAQRYLKILDRAGLILHEQFSE